MNTQKCSERAKATELFEVALDLAKLYPNHSQVIEIPMGKNPKTVIRLSSKEVDIEIAKMTGDEFKFKISLQNGVIVNTSNPESLFISRSLESFKNTKL